MEEPSSSSSLTAEKSGEMPVPQRVAETMPSSLMTNLEASFPAIKPGQEPEPSSSLIEQSSSKTEKPVHRTPLRWRQKVPLAVDQKYDRSFKEVEELYNKEDWDGAIEAAKYNLTDPTLPKWHIIKNHMMWAHAAEWYAETEEHRLIAESVYADAVRLTPKRLYPQEWEALRRLGESLDELREAQEEDLRAGYAMGPYNGAFDLSWNVRSDEEASAVEDAFNETTSTDLAYRAKNADIGEGGSRGGGGVGGEGGSVVQHCEPGGQATPPQAEMMKDLELLEVRIQAMALELGGFAGIGFNIQAGDKAKKLRAAIDAGSLEQHSRRKEELEAMLQAGFAETQSKRIAVLVFERGMNEIKMEELRVRNEEIENEIAKLRV
ncbi:unnamed protein product [Zymoseptoria tritici ST99CH_3D7]|uniref:Uncharacterized protein n=2 Tax=Zymoseptoria tritici TaxID=1047171 RepID=A0A1X7RHK6_ZYMT9|nr:unnamed protein product [Zymoseptoria tritici ST99CH_3D7]SMR43279.1 unnamed protein product [Zymoseptoria tritici ST99CH_1E4]